MHRTTAKALILLSTLVLIVVLVIAALSGAKTVMIVATLIWLVVYLILGHFTRCPHCGRWPGRDEFFAEYCSRCGESLND